MAVVTLEEAEACTLAVADSTEEAALFTAEDMAVATMVDTVAATTADTREAAMVVTAPMQARVAVIVAPAFPRLGIRGLGKVIAHAIHRRDGISFHPATRAIWVALQPQRLPREARRPPRPVEL